MLIRSDRAGLLVAAMLGIAAAAGPASAQATLSLEETKQCLVDERDLGRQRQSLADRGPAITREETELQALNRRVEEAQSRVFLGSVPDPSARTEYETLRDMQYREFDIFSEKQRRYNDDVARYNDRLATYNQRCGERRYTDYNLRLARRQLGWEP